MSELTTNRLWNTGPKDRPSPFARMIPGMPGMPHPRVSLTTFAPTTGASPACPVNAIDESTTRRTPARTPILELLPHPTGDRFMLFQLVAADLIVLAIVCGAFSSFFPAWGLLWPICRFLRFW
jgi:hypothetical protein